MTESTVSIKLPNFWPTQPAAWFTHVEAQFQIRGIKSDDTKYYHVVAALEQQTAERLVDVLEHPPVAEKYTNLKERLLSTFGLTRQQRATRLLSMSGLGDRSPSQLMDEMLALLGDHQPCLLFEELYKQQLPADIRMQLATADFTDPRALAQQADALWASRPQPVIAAARSAGQPRPAPRRTASPTQHDGLCFFHRRFGDKARQCRPPCCWSGNGSPGRQ